jgi:hypothetical protein
MKVAMESIYRVIIPYIAELFSYIGIACIAEPLAAEDLA